jgi:hypothetical protein
MNEIEKSFKHQSANYFLDDGKCEPLNWMFRQFGEKLIATFYCQFL